MRNSSIMLEMIVAIKRKDGGILKRIHHIADTLRMRHSLLGIAESYELIFREMVII